MTNLENLAAEVCEGWRVKIVDHDYGPDSRDDVVVTPFGDGDGVILTPKNPWSSQGQKYPTMTLWWKCHPDFEVSGRTVRVYHSPSPHTGKPRVVAKTFFFSPPSRR